MKRLLLFAGAFGWGVSILGVLLPWRIMDEVLSGLGAAAPVADLRIRYWLRMAAGSWSVIGFLYLAAFLAPRKYRRMIPLLGVGTLAEGLVLLFHGLMLDLPLLPFAGDVGFCLVVGGGLLLAEAKPGDAWPLLAGRRADASAWKLDGVDVGITAAYLEAAGAEFDLTEPRDIFRLRPDDSLFELYDSRYRSNRWSADNMELEECALAFETLCRFSGEEFDCRAPLREVLRTIARCRGNQAPDVAEIEALHLAMKLLLYLKS